MPGSRAWVVNYELGSLLIKVERVTNVCFSSTTYFANDQPFKTFGDYIFSRANNKVQTFISGSIG